jgi:dienelactone hydrolase
MNTTELTFAVDGVRCAATLYRPDQPTGEIPCVVMGHGLSLTRRDGVPDYAARFAAAGVAAFAFDYRFWGDSDGEPRRWFSIPRQLEDWRAAVAAARAVEGVDGNHVAVWGMSLGGGHALHIAQTDRRIAAAVALAPMTDGLPLALAPAPSRVVLGLMACALRETLGRRPVTVQVAGSPGELAALVAPEALPGFTRLTAGNGWRNEISSSGLYGVARYRPVRRASRIAAPVLLQLGENDAMVPLAAIEKTAALAPRAELRRYPIDHFECFWPEHLDLVAADQVTFLRHHLFNPEPSPKQPAVRAS